MFVLQSTHCWVFFWLWFMEGLQTMNHTFKKGYGQVFIYHDSTDSDVIIESKMN